MKYSKCSFCFTNIVPWPLAPDVLICFLPRDGDCPLFLCSPVFMSSACSRNFNCKILLTQVLKHGWEECRLGLGFVVTYVPQLVAGCALRVAFHAIHAASAATACVTLTVRPPPGSLGGPTKLSLARGAHHVIAAGPLDYHHAALGASHRLSALQQLL